MRRICVYCGSSSGKQPQYGEAAQALAIEFLKREISLVYGGASVGLMGTIADTVIQGGGEVIGVMPRSLVEQEVAHQGLTELKIVDSMHARKATMLDISDGFIALPGGLGTIEELFEMLTWSQLGLHQKPCALLNVESYFNQLIAFLHHATSEAFIKQIHCEMLLIETVPQRLLDRMATYQWKKVAKWIEPEDKAVGKR